MNIEKGYLTIKEASKYLSLAESTIRNKIYNEKTIKAVKVGGAVRISREEIERLIKPIE